VGRDEEMAVKIKPIGIIRSPHKSVAEIPRDCGSAVGEVIVSEDYEKGLQDIEGFSHIMILWLFHKSKRYSLLVKPLYYEGLHGVFTTRHPDRPNPIAVTVVELLERKGNKLRIKGIDAVDKTPLVDIKPYTLRDIKTNIRTGWLRH